MKRRYHLDYSYVRSDRRGVVAVCHPDWRGVRTAAFSFGDPVLEMTAADKPGAVADFLAKQSTEVMVLHAFIPGAAELLAAVRNRGVATRAIHYSSPAQHGEGAGESDVIDSLVELTAAGVIGRLGMAKEGVAEALRALGTAAMFVPARPPQLPELRPAQLSTPSPNIGVFAESFWRKNVVTQLAAVALIEGATAHVLARPAVKYLEGLAMVEHGLTTWESFLDVVAAVDLNMYVSLSECLPLTPMESYAAGVPCLISRTSALFRDDPELWRLTTVAELDNPRLVAAAASRLLGEADRAVGAARDWLASWDVQAAATYAEFVSP